MFIGSRPIESLPLTVVLGVHPASRRLEQHPDSCHHRVAVADRVHVCSWCECSAAQASIGEAQGRERPDRRLSRAGPDLQLAPREDRLCEEQDVRSFSLFMDLSELYSQS